MKRIQFKITKRYKVLRNTFFQIGDIFIKIETENLQNNEIVISLKNKNKSVNKFSPEESPVTIGRKECNVTIDSNSISKIHITLEFNI
jgi:hypothetical protein